jgi:hypothetical protein
MLESKRKGIDDYLVEGAAYVFASLVAIPVLLLLLRILLGALWWLFNGTFGDVSFCAISTFLEVSFCASETGAVGIDRILNWFLLTDVLYVFPAISVLSLIIGVALWFTVTSKRS